MVAVAVLVMIIMLSFSPLQVFNEACQHMEPKAIYTALAGIYEKSNKLDKADGLLEVGARKMEMEEEGPPLHAE